MSRSQYTRFYRNIDGKREPGLDASLNPAPGVFGECIDIPLQRNVTFHSEGSLYLQIPIYFLGWVVISLIVNSINSVWVGVASCLVPVASYNIVTIMFNEGVSMVIFFIILPVSRY